MATHSAAVTLAFILITFLHVVFGELVPKNLALQTPDRAALWLARPLTIFAWITRPFTLIMSGAANLVVRLCGRMMSDNRRRAHQESEDRRRCRRD